MFVYLPICGQTRQNLIKNKYQILTYYINNTYAKLAPNTPQNKKIKEIMRYTGGHPFPDGLVKILLGIPIGPILNFLERTERELSENVSFAFFWCIVFEL